ncbi:two component transcriptional regulator, LuxR family [Anaerocolumna jejuensis DSM 15929]|uniref:Stage 0 sporulation protein A homolog n=1 Tax=Anaerocolumna jejuensis DSM 15929 TaxID=1121322 RepID=A0A1M6MFK4_9FIRM|nr:response regulator transcription factor [Anaerocolumna jejuensis]SHJ82272.1 two component transcriptional regulator, LuxR family [Anaerocolumna jejuensis DSM 15929]
MKVLIIDDDKLVCSSLKIILSSDAEVNVCGSGNSGEDAIKLFDETSPDILLMDIRMEPMSGLVAGENILNQHPEAKILYLTTFLDDDYIIKALNIGAKGYMLKQDFESILPALYAVHKGQNVYGNEIITKLPSLLQQPGNRLDYENYGITDKEYEIICKIADGLSNKEIAELLFLSEGTVRNYISLILEKLSLRDRTQIAIFYYKNS